MGFDLVRRFGLLAVPFAIAACSGEVGEVDAEDGDDATLADSDESEIGTVTEALATTKSCRNAPAASRWPFNPDRAITITKVRSMTCATASRVWRAPGSLQDKGWSCRLVSGGGFSSTNKCTKSGKTFWYAFAE